MAKAPTDWPAERVRAAIHARGISMEALAIQHGYSSAVVRKALIGSSPAGEKLIACLIGIPLQEIWPSRYFPDGRSRARPMRRREVTKRQPTAATQIGSAA